MIVRALLGLGAALLLAWLVLIVGLVVALQLAVPNLNVGPWLTFGRLRPLHTNAVIFAFAGNAFFTGAYYSTQRLLKTRMFSDGLSRFHFWGWQAIIVAAALTLPLGFTQAKEYAELEWPIDLLIAVVWVAYAVVFFGTTRSVTVPGSLNTDPLVKTSERTGTVSLSPPVSFSITRNIGDLP